MRCTSVLLLSKTLAEGGFISPEHWNPMGSRGACLVGRLMIAMDTAAIVKG